MTRPYVGETVHYQSYGSPGGEFPSVPRAAIVTQVNNQIEGNSVGLCVINPTGLFFPLDIQFSEKNLPGTWNWVIQAL